MFFYMELIFYALEVTRQKKNNLQILFVLFGRVYESVDNISRSWLYTSKIDEKQSSGGKEYVIECHHIYRAAPWFLPLLKFHYNNYWIKSIRRVFLIVDD